MKTLAKLLHSATIRIVGQRAALLAMFLCAMIVMLAPRGALSGEEIKNTIMIDNFTFSPAELNVAV